MPSPATSPPPRPAAPRLRSAALYEQVAEQLRARILAHQLAPGSWIDEQAIAADYAISRTPLREALKVLASEGLVTMKLRRGAYVTDISPRDLAEVLHLLALLESDAAADAATQVDELQAIELQTLLRQLENAADDANAFVQATEDFHLRLLQIGGNQRRLLMVRDLRRVMRLHRPPGELPHGRTAAALEDLRQVTTALKEHNWARAKRLMQQHLAQGRDPSRRFREDVMTTTPRLALIAIVSRNGGIGKDNALLFRLSADLQHFKRTTLGCPVVMGRKTWESLPSNARPLPGRLNIVVTRNPDWHAEGASTVHALDEALRLAAGAETVFVIGGAELYAAALPMASDLVLTEVDRDADADVWFPHWDRRQFKEVSRERHHAGPPNDFDYAFVTYRRI